MKNDQPSNQKPGETLCFQCRHSVEVRGMEDIVCLAHLLVRHPLSVLDDCADFESGKVPSMGHVVC